jgi:hypothetical protein
LPVNGDEQLTETNGAMSELATSTTSKRNQGIQCIDPEEIVIALPRRGAIAVSGGVRTLDGVRVSETDLDDVEPVLAD